MLVWLFAVYWRLILLLVLHLGHLVNLVLFVAYLFIVIWKLGSIRWFY